jgi:hypothetical protein
MKDGSSHRYKFPQGVLRARLEGEEVMLNPATGVYHLLNATGCSLAFLLEEGKSLEEAAAGVADETGAPLDRVREDARAFVDAMLERQLLEEVTTG